MGEYPSVAAAEIADRFGVSAPDFYRQVLGMVSAGGGGRLPAAVLDRVTAAARRRIWLGHDHPRKRDRRLPALLRVDDPACAASMIEHFRPGYCAGYSVHVQGPVDHPIHRIHPVQV